MAVKFQNAQTLDEKNVKKMIERYSGNRRRIAKALGVSVPKLKQFVDSKPELKTMIVGNQNWFVDTL
jgi:flagellar biosynthesis component FlhA